MTLQSKIKNIITDATLSAKQKTLFLSLEAEALVDYMPISADVLTAKEAGIICDMFEGNAPFKPRYVLPDYAKFLQQGSEYLELEPATNLDEAINLLTIIYHHVPSVTNIPVYLGQLDQILLPFVTAVSEDVLYRKLKNFWIMLDRTLPDAFMHVNIGPTDNIVCRMILKIDAELKQVAPNLTFMYDPQITPESLLQQACDNICECSKPHIANYPMFSEAFGAPGFGIVSCYNSLPIAGGANTLVRMNLKEVALRSKSIEEFLTTMLPHYSALMFELIEARSAFLHQESNFFTGFLTTEGLINEDRFAPMFGIFGMAEAVNILMEKSGSTAKYGHNQDANAIALKISEALNEIVTTTPVKHGLNGRALLHSQGGISCDHEVTPGIRIPYGTEPDPVVHIKALAAHHKYYTSGISEILTIEETIKNNPLALMQLCKGALALGFREFTANVASNDLVRVTGYMVKLSDISKFKEQGSRTNTTWLGTEASENTRILERQPRVVSREMSPVYSAK